MPSPWELITGGFLGDLNPLDGIDGGEFLGFDETTGDPMYRALQVSHVGEPYVPKVPFSPLLILTTPQPTRTTSGGSWTLTNVDRPPITAWEIERALSTNDGVSFGAYAPISGSPFSPTPQTFAESGLSTGTPEHIFRYRVRGVNADGEGLWSNEASTQWDATPPTPPTAVTNLVVSNITATSARLTWTETPDPTVTEHQIWQFQTPGTIRVAGIDPTATTYVWTGLATGVALTQINVRRVNPDGTSPPSNNVAFTPQAPVSFDFNPVMGCSNSDENHGGTDAWEGWRVYQYDQAAAIANRTGAEHPTILAMTDQGTFTSYNAAFNATEPFLESFYYGAGSAARQDVQLHIGNGNEYGDGVHSGNIAGFVQGCRGIYEATRVLNANGTRRYPLASSWIDPTHNQEQQRDNLQRPGNPSPGPALSVAESAAQATPYLDGIAWSMYPPGRQNTAEDPTFDWPSFDEAHRYNANRGFLLRCFMRTYECQYPSSGGDDFPGGTVMAGNPYISSFRPLKIAVWEIGTGDTPGDQTARPWYACHGLVASMGRLANQFDLEMPMVTWWDQEKNEAGAPQNVLSDEPAATGTQISTRVAWQQWQTYDHFGIGHPDGTHPTAWSTNPKTSWKHRDINWFNTWNQAMNQPLT